MLFKIILIGLISLNSFAMSFQHTIQIYYRLGAANNLKLPPLKQDRTSDINAEYDMGDGVYVTTGLLTYVQNDDEMAMVLGHELGHYTFHHILSNHANEYAADAKGAYYMSHAGYTICKGALALRRFNDPADKTHPASEDRYKRLGCR